jgi:hypothetical protein
MGIWYCTRESVKAAVDIKNSAAANKQIDRIIDDVSRDIDTLCHRKFYPRLATHRFDWPSRYSGTAWRLWLNGDTELVSVSAVTAGGQTISTANVLLYPEEGPPYDRVELDRSTSSVFSAGNTPQRSVVITGLYASAPNDEKLVATLAEALDDSETQVDLSRGDLAGVGSLLRVDSEYMVVTEREQLSLGITLSANLTERNNDTSVTISASTPALKSGETILIGTERMEIVDVTGTTLVVQRGVDGSVLTTHTSGVTIYSPRTYVVERGAQGSTAASHLTSAPVYAWTPPSPIVGLAHAEALVQLARENSQYVRVVGTGEGQSESRGGDLKDKREKVYNGYARMGRTGAV